jgi:hypothetical protein
MKNKSLEIKDVADLEAQISQMRNSLKADRLDMSFGEIMATYARGELIISPEFQRLFRWDIEQRTRFLESIILGIPIPPIFVAEDKKGRWELVDGLQRISTILSFFGNLTGSGARKENGWMLSEAVLVPALKGYTSKTLPANYILNIKRAVCRVEIIKWDSLWDMRYELFSRLNTGGSPLTEQEVRNSIFRGGLKRLYAFVDEMKKSEDFIKLVDLSENRRRKLYDDELIIRFLSLVKKWERVDTSISNHATAYMQEMLKRREDISKDDEARFRDVLMLLSPLGREIFRVKSTFSASLYDAITVATAEHIDRFKANPGKLVEAIKILKADSEFREMRGGASSKTRTRVRIGHAVSVFGSVFG